MPATEKIALVGVAHVGANLARRLNDCGYAVTAVFDAHAPSATALSPALGATPKRPIDTPARFPRRLRRIKTLAQLCRRSLALCAAFFLGALTHAQPPAAGRALFYTEPGYKGECLIVAAGGMAENLEFVRDNRGRTFNDRIASVRFEGPVRVALFEHSQLRGAFTWLNRDTPDLSAYSLGDKSDTKWNETVSSVQVETVRRGANVFTAWDRRDAERAVRAAYRDYLGREPDPAGLRLYTGRLLDAGWSEEQLRDVFRRSPEFKERDLDAVVRRVYREELGRDPDPSGVAAYARSLSRGMTESELRAELRRSGEGAERKARETVTRAYREVLRREPDPAGLENYVRMMRQKGWDEAKVRAALRSGDEFRQLPR